MFKSQEIAHKNQLPDSQENKQSGGLVAQVFHCCLAWATGSCMAVEWALVPRGTTPMVPNVGTASLPTCLCPVGIWVRLSLLGLALHPASKASGHCQAWQFSFSSQKSNHRDQIPRGTARLALRAHLVAWSTYFSIFLSVLAQRKNLISSREALT